MVKINNSPNTKICFKGVFPSPIGDMFFVMSEDNTLLGLSFSNDIFEEIARSIEDNKEDNNEGSRMLPLGRDMNVGRDMNGEMGKEVIRQLNEYYKGLRKDFDLVVGFLGTPFQILVWKALLNIPYGKTASYGDIAKRIGHPRAYRAVGSAVGKNRIDIVVPCHRVIKGDGSMGNYGGGIDRKRFLLGLEAGRELFSL